MKTKRFNEYQLWDTRKMKPGTYIYEVIEGERKIHSGKIVIQ